MTYNKALTKPDEFWKRVSKNEWKTVFGTPGWQCCKAFWLNELKVQMELKNNENF